MMMKKKKKKKKKKKQRKKIRKRTIRPTSYFGALSTLSAGVVGMSRRILHTFKATFDYTWHFSNVLGHANIRANLT